MIARATPQAIRSIMRRRHISPEDKLNIITFCTHERYEQQLCKTGHNFFSLVEGRLSGHTGKTWDTTYGKIPSNYYPIENMPSPDVDIDLVLCQTLCERINISKRIRADFNIPIISLMHVLPHVEQGALISVEEQIARYYMYNEDVDQRVFISDFNRSAWGCDESNAAFIEHGMDCDFWMTPKVDARKNVCLSVVNDWPNRDWCCGFELWKNVVGFGTQDQLPIQPVGNSPGFSDPAKSIEHLREIYHNSRIFINTSTHSPVPTALMEAMACGCAIVSTETCMIPEIIEHGVNGFMSNDPKELRKYATMLIEDENLAKKLGNNAQKTIKEKYSLEKFISKWNELFYSTIKNYKEY
tara:strand:+ start:1663 stop:2727 length:1065 start_codon:yes stop_codon:yes gene_type:complete